MNTVSRFKTILYSVFSNLFFFIVVSFDSTLSIYNNNTWYTPIIILFFYLILIAFLPNDFQKSFRKLFKSKTSVTIIKIYLVIQIILILYFGIFFFNSYVNTEIPIIFFLLIIVLVSIIVGRTTFVNIINLSSIFFIIASLFYLIPILSNTDRYIDYLLPFDFDIKNIYYLFLLVFIPIDNILIILYSNQVNKNLRKLDLIIAGIIFFCLICFIYTDSLTLISYKIYEEYNFSLFFHWQIYNDNKYISNYDIALLFITFVSIIFKLSLNFNLLKITSKRTLPVIGIFTIILTLVLYFINIDMLIITKYAIYILVFFGLVIYTIIQLALRRKLNEGSN